MAISTGMTENDFKKLRYVRRQCLGFYYYSPVVLRSSDIINAIPELDYICVDVANGYSEHFVEFVRLVRKEFPDKTIFVRLTSTLLTFED